MPDRAAPAGGEYHLAVEYARAQPVWSVLGDGECAVSGEGGDAERRADVEPGLVGQRYGLIGGHDGVLGGSAGGPPGGGHEQPHTLTDPARVDPVTDGVNHTGPVEVRGDLGEQLAVGDAGAGLPVGRVLRDAGLVRTRVDGVRRLIRLRYDEVELRFPGLLTMLRGHDPANAAAEERASTA